MRGIGRFGGRGRPVPKADPRAELGRRGEAEAVRHLRGLGYRVLERGYRTRYGEIDIIAEEAGTLVFVEVKARRGGGFGEPAEAVDPRKQGRIARLAESYLQARPHPGPCRFDVVAVRFAPGGPPRVEVVRDAFAVDDAGGRNP